MGFDQNKIPFLKNVHLNGKLPDIDFNNINTVCNVNGQNEDYHNIDMNFRPQYGWTNHIEK